MKKYENMTKKELSKLKTKRWEKMMLYRNKADAYLGLLEEVNAEQVKRLIKSLRKSGERRK